MANAFLVNFNSWIKDFLKKNFKIIILVLAALIVLLFFRKMLIVTVFLAVNSVIALIWMFFRNRTIAIELVTFTSLLCFYAYGLKAGLFMIFVLVLIHNLITANMSINNFLAIFISPLLILAMSPFKGVGIVNFGIIYSIIFNFIFWILVLFLHTGSIYRRTVFTITNLIWTIFVFSNFAEPLLRLLV